MTWEHALTARIEALTGVTAVVGQRIHWVQAPRNTELPYLVLTVLNDERQPLMEGTQEFRESMVQADFYGASYDQLIPAREALFTGLGVAGTAGGVRFDPIEVIRVETDAVDMTDGAHAVRASNDLLIWHD